MGFRAGPRASTDPACCAEEGSAPLLGTPPRSQCWPHADAGPFCALGKDLELEALQGLALILSSRVTPREDPRESRSVTSWELCRAASRERREGSHRSSTWLTLTELTHVRPSVTDASSSSRSGALRVPRPRCRGQPHRHQPAQLLWSRSLCDGLGLLVSRSCECPSWPSVLG